MGVIQNCIDGKYADDTVFQMINSNFLTLREEDIDIYKTHLDTVVRDTLVPLMKRNKLFNLMFKKIICGGSYNKGTKYGKPEEFDLDLVVKLPINYNKIIIVPYSENYHNIKIKIERGYLGEDWQKYSRILNGWLTSDNYLDQNKFRDWMQSIFIAVLSSFPKRDNGYVMRTSDAYYTVTYKFCGPAFTLTITTGKIKISVDIVPCLEFFDIPLENGYRPMIYGNKKIWMVVPKPLPDVPHNNILWRLCFQQQEKSLLIGDIKQIIRLLKKFRDCQNWNSIVSYYVETIIYHELAKNKNYLDEYMGNSRTTLFMIALEKLRRALENGYLSYFWHESVNLFGTIDTKDLNKYASQLSKIIKIIDNRIENDRFILADMVLKPHESYFLRQAVKCSTEQKVFYSYFPNRTRSQNNQYYRRSNGRDYLKEFVTFVLICIFFIFLLSTMGNSTSN